MHVELSEDAQNNLETKNQQQLQSETDDAQKVSGSQVACTFVSKERGQMQSRRHSHFQVVALSISAVSTVVAVYLVFVFPL
jgi:hypothetical protein